MNVEDHGDKSRKKHVKKHKKRKERDESVNFGNREGENDHSEVLAVKEKSRKKAKLSKSGGEDAQHKSDPNRTSCVENGKSKRKLGVSQNDMDFGNKVKSKKVVKDKEEKQKKEKKNKNKDSITIGDGSDIMKEKRKKKKKKSYESNVVEFVNSKISEEKNCVGGQSRVEAEHVKENKYKNDHSNGKMVEKPVKGRSATIVDVKLSQHGRLNSSLKQKSDGKEKYLVDGMEKSDHIKKKKVKPIQDNEEKTINNPSMNIKRKKVKPIKDNEEKTINKGDPSMIVSDQNAEHVRNSDRKKNGKRVKFSSKIEVFPISDDTKVRKINQEKKSSFGKRFTQEEDKKIKEAVFNYIAAIGLGEEGLNMVLNPKSHVQVRNCWKEIIQFEKKTQCDGNCIRGDRMMRARVDSRTYEKLIKLDSCMDLMLVAIRLGSFAPLFSLALLNAMAGYALFHLSFIVQGLLGQYNMSIILSCLGLFFVLVAHHFVPVDIIPRFHEEHGPKWKNMGKELGKFRVHVKDTWRRINLPNLKKGPWSQDEYQALFDLVNMDLRMKAYQERESDNCMLRDNISWEAISRKMGTRTGMQCCLKWYGQLESSLVKEGLWATEDDYLLVNALLTLDACCVEDVNWDALIPDRSGDCCRRRFKQMINHLGAYGFKSFQEQVEVLSNRYCPDLVEALSTTNVKASAE
ncbi:hypothetical protein Syun_022545 [Stephania yunnanensis]|uniref:Myb-like domain-containing protein n=1 Tax=Stephania yunnanensis TaxID=152371 RepID=A0AAP0F7X3_9MAGN